MSLLRPTLRVLTIGYWLILFVMTHIPQTRIPRAPIGDKTAHLIAYFVLGALLSLTMWVSDASQRHTWLRVMAIGLVYAVLDEVTQEFVGRYGEVRDFVADAIGLAAGVVLVAFVRRAYVEPAERRGLAPTEKVS